MNWTVEYVADKQFVKVICEGDFNANDHLRMIQDITSREYWQPGMHAFFDNRKVNFDKTDYKEVREAVRNTIKNNELVGSGKAAVLMKSVADFGIGRQFQLLANDNISAELHIFQDEKQALDWLLKQQKNSTGN